MRDHPNHHHAAVCGTTKARRHRTLYTSHARSASGLVPQAPSSHQSGNEHLAPSLSSAAYLRDKVSHDQHTQGGTDRFSALYRAAWILLYRIFVPNTLPAPTGAPVDIMSEASGTCTAMAEELHQLFELYAKSFQLRNMTFTLTWSMVSRGRERYISDYRLMQRSTRRQRSMLWTSSPPIQQCPPRQPPDWACPCTF
jgi:hypothetical protein